MFSIFWQTRKIKSLFNLKHKNLHKSNVIYRADIAHVAKPTLGKQKQTSQCERQNMRTSLTILSQHVT